MAVDTRDKRASAIMCWRQISVPPNPDGAISSSADRQHMGFAYSGITVSGGSSGSDDTILTLQVYR